MRKRRCVHLCERPAEVCDQVSVQQLHTPSVHVKGGSGDCHSRPESPAGKQGLQPEPVQQRVVQETAESVSEHMLAPLGSLSNQPKPSTTRAATAGSIVGQRTLCDCCEMPLDEGTARVPGPGSEVGVDDLEAMYEEVDWVSLEHCPLPTRSRRCIASQVESIRRVPFQLALSALKADPGAVKAELEDWLGPQAPTQKGNWSHRGIHRQGPVVLCKPEGPRPRKKVSDWALTMARICHGRVIDACSYCS